MAREFDAGSSQYLSVNQVPVTGHPMTVSCWFYVFDVDTRYNLITLADLSSSDSYIYLFARGDLADDPINVMERGRSDGGVAYAYSFTANAWHHACAVLYGTTSRYVYLDGIAGAEGTDGCHHPTGLDNTTIGGDQIAGTPENFTDGRIAEVGMWDTTLTDAEVASLAAGYCPLFVRPQNLVAYWPLIRDRDIDIVGGYDLTAYGSPTIAAHCPIMRPIAPQVIIPHAAAGSNIPVIMQHYKKMRVA